MKKLTPYSWFIFLALLLPMLPVDASRCGEPFARVLRQRKPVTPARISSEVAILGLELGGSSEQVRFQLLEAGLKPELQGRTWLECAEVQSQVYDGVPPGLVVRQGRTRVVFLRDQLVRLELFFLPSYRNFIELRKQLFDSMGERFEVVEQEEVLDDLLQAHLSLFAGEGGNERTEELLLQSLRQGSTRFRYLLGDSRRLLGTQLSLCMGKDRLESPVPELMLQYTSLEGEALLQEALEARNVKILPD